METDVKISFISIFQFSWFSIMILSYTILPILQLETQQPMTSQIRSHIEYLIQYSFAHFTFKIDEKHSLIDGFNMT